MENIPPGCRYTSKSVYVDADTGEQLRRETAENKSRYIIIKTTKHTAYNANKTTAVITYIKECRRQPQQKLPFN